MSSVTTLPSEKLKIILLLFDLALCFLCFNSYKESRWDYVRQIKQSYWSSTLG